MDAHHRHLCRLVEQAHVLYAGLMRHPSMTDRVCDLRLRAAARLGRRAATLIAYRKVEGL